MMPSGAAGGRLARIDARLRVVIAVLFAFVTVSLAALPALTLAFAIAVIVARLGRLPAAATLRRLLAVDAFLVPVLLLLPFSTPGAAVASVLGWPVSGEGLREAARILLTANAVVLATLALVGSIPAARLAEALAGLGVPERLTRLLGLTARGIALIGPEFARLRQAMRARGFRPRGDRHTWGSYGYLYGMLLVRSFERAERTLGAMKCRGYGAAAARAPRSPLRSADVAFAGGALVLLLALGVAERAAG